MEVTLEDFVVWSIGDFVNYDGTINISREDFKKQSYEYVKSQTTLKNIPFIESKFEEYFNKWYEIYSPEVEINI